MEHHDNLRQFIVGLNNLEGQLPDLSRTYPNLQTLDLGSNSLIGSIPVGFANIPFLSTLNLSGNKLSKGIAALGSVAQLKTLNVSGNEFRGAIPSDWGNLAGELFVMYRSIVKLRFTNTSPFQELLSYLIYLTTTSPSPYHMSWEHLKMLKLNWKETCLTGKYWYDMNLIIGCSNLVTSNIISLLLFL